MAVSRTELPRIPTRDLARAIGLFFLFLVAMRFLWVARNIFITAFLGVLFSLPLCTAVDWAETRFRIRRGIASPLIVLLTLAILGGLGTLAGPSIKKQMGQVQEKLPEVVRKIEGWVTVANGGKPQPQAKAPQPQKRSAAPSQPQQNQPKESQPGTTGEKSAQGETSEPPDHLKDLLGEELGSFAKFLFPFVSSVFAAVGGLLIVLFVAMYIAAEPRLYEKGLIHLIPKEARPRGKEFLAEAAHTLRQWLVARLIAMVLIGLISLGLFLLIGVKGAAALALIAGLLEFVPFFGPVVSAVPAIAMGLVDSPQKALWVALACIFVQQLEGQVITPLLLQKKIDIPPALTIIGVAVFGVVFGLLGMLIAEPLVVLLLLAVKMLYVEDVVGDEVKT